MNSAIAFMLLVLLPTSLLPAQRMTIIGGPLAAVSSARTFVKIQSLVADNVTTSGLCSDSTHCTIDAAHGGLATIGAGRFLFLATCDEGDSRTYSTVTGDSTWALNPASFASANCRAAYVASSTGGGTSIAIVESGSSFHRTIYFAEFSYTGATLALDAANNSSLDFSANPPAPSLTVAGTDDLVIQIAGDDGSDFTGIGGSYVLDKHGTGDSFMGSGYKFNVATYSAPSWTQGTCHHCKMSVAAFK